MYKIYSRPRIRIPKILTHSTNRIYSPKTRKISTILIILTIAFITVKLILDAVLPIFDTLCESKAKSIATIISNEQATNIMKNHSYDELFTIEKNQNGDITMIKSNVLPINEIISDIANKIQEQINKQGKDKVEIALGSFTGSKLLAGRGPSVEIKISTVGNVETDLRSEFIEKGINQTLHQVYLEVKCNVNILTPFDNISREITNQVLLMENVIVGNIPSSYYNLEGLQDTLDAMEVIE